MLMRALARNLQRGQARGAKVVVERAGAALADHVERSGHGERGDRQAARQRLDDDVAEGVGLRGKDECVGAGVGAGQRFPVEGAEKMRVRLAALERRPRRAVADDDRHDNVSEFFLDDGA